MHAYSYIVIPTVIKFSLKFLNVVFLIMSLINFLLQIHFVYLSFLFSKSTFYFLHVAFHSIMASCSCLIEAELNSLSETITDFLK